MTTPPTSAEKMFLNGFDLTACGSCGRKVMHSHKWLVVRNGEDEIIIVQCPKCRNPVAEIRACETCARRWPLLANPPKFTRQRRRFCSWRCDGGKEVALTEAQRRVLQDETDAKSALLAGKTAAGEHTDGDQKWAAERSEPTLVGRVERAR